MTDDTPDREQAATTTTPSGSGLDDTGAAERASVPAVPPPPPDEENPALIDAHKTFVITLVSIGLFAAFVVLFVL